MFINSLLGEQVRAVPLLSPLILYHWALDAVLSGNDDSARAVAACILRMTCLNANFNWQQYKEFHAEWEVIKRELYLN